MRGVAAAQANRLGPAEERRRERDRKGPVIEDQR